MKREEFDILLNSFAHKNWTDEYMAEEAFVTMEDIQNARKRLINEGYITPDLNVTKIGLDAMEPYKVDNAIIMAAGLSSRCFPLSKILPKGLFVVKGQVLIEREIEQLQQAGIKKIILVTGYLKEKFEYLRDKYGVMIIENEEYKIRNNTSSIYAARRYLKNSYICCADNYFANNIFDSYVYDSYYTCKFAEGYIDEFCLTEVDEKGYIRRICRGGSDTYYTMGAVYFSKSFSQKFISLLEREYDKDDVKGMLIDTFHINFIHDMPLTTYRKYTDDEIKEFDTISEFEQFDPEFKSFYDETMRKSLFERYQHINRYAGVPTNRLTGRLHYNENLWGPSPKCIDALYKTTMEDLYLYDSAEQDDLIVELEKKLGIDRHNIFLHNGSAESIKTMFSVTLNPNDYVLLPTPGWSYYSGIVEYKFGKTVFYDIVENGSRCFHDVEDILQKARQYNPKIIVITSPAMPTGNAISADHLEKIVRENPGSVVLLDEAYYGFREYDIDVKYMINNFDNIIFSRTFSKYYGLANLRIGYGICSTRAMHALWLDLPLHRLPHISKKMAIAALNDEKYYVEITKEAIEVREWFCKELSQIPYVHPYESDANFVYIGLSGYDVKKIKEYMQDKGYLIRIFESRGEEHLRITIVPRDIMEDCLSKLKTAFQKYRIQL